MSPYLFLFYMDILSRMTSMTTNINQFNGFPVCKGGRLVSHLFFADDAFFFLKINTSACQAVISVVQRFHDIYLVRC